MIKRTICFTNPAYLSLRNGQLEVRLPELGNDTSLPDIVKPKAASASIPIEDIGFVILDHKQITLTQALIDALLQNNCALVSCDAQHLPTGLMLPLAGNSLQSERFRQQIDVSLPLKKQLWQQTVQQKIRNQATLLASARGEEVGGMMAWVSQVRSGDADNLEGRAAAYYWPRLFPMEPTFVRHREGVPPNALLNYGYAILRAIVARALVGAGLLPTLGIHHHNRYNAYCLADDIMEPYRPYVDQLVVDLHAKHPQQETITKEMKISLLSIPTLDVHIDGHRSPLMVAVAQTATSLQKCYAGQQRRLLYPEMQPSDE
ncbi:MAG: type II CRISPR-associated endonuclease Cas1 [Bacteroidales bacterium]|nr:type II CRISPR-associated endonuclease Cas1 [Bacteroidales bacterium]